MARHVMTVELDDMAFEVITKRSRKTGRTQKHLVSVALTRMAQWPEPVQSLFWDDVPASMANKEDYWEEVRRELIAGAERCRGKMLGK
jgi:hypothetical protein